MLTPDGPKGRSNTMSASGDPDAQVADSRMMSDIVPAMRPSCDGQ